MVDVNVHIEHASMVLEQLQNAQHQIIHIAEPCMHTQPTLHRHSEGESSGTTSSNWQQRKIIV